MKQVYKRPYQYRFTHPPKALLKAKLDNIALIPASLLPFKETWQKIANKLPTGSVFLCHTQENDKQRKVLEKVEMLLKAKGHMVQNLLWSV